MAKTRTPAHNVKNDRRRRVIKMIEKKLQLKDSELAPLNPKFENVKEYRANLTAHLEHLKKIQSAKGGSL